MIFLSRSSQYWNAEMVWYCPILVYQYMGLRTSSIHFIKHTSSIHFNNIFSSCLFWSYFKGIFASFGPNLLVYKQFLVCIIVFSPVFSCWILVCYLTQYSYLRSYYMNIINQIVSNCNFMLSETIIFEIILVYHFDFDEILWCMGNQINLFLIYVLFKKVM